MALVLWDWTSPKPKLNRIPILDELETKPIMDNVNVPAVHIKYKITTPASQMC